MTSTNIISPCSRLNEDVLREIFVRCANPFHVRHYTGMSIRQYPQLSVSRVCSSWRHIALLTPQLWDDICICDLTEASLSIAREYLSRAWSLPISITLDEEIGKIGHGWRSLLTEFLSSYRLRRLQASGKDPNIYLILPDLPQRSVADLEGLWFNLQFDNGLSIELNDIRYPKLAVVECRCNVSGCSSILRVFDCPGVVMTVIESWDLLSRCPSLEKCCFKLKEDGSPGPVSVPRILLQHLDTLQVESEERDVSEERRVIPFSTFIEALALPNLETLVVAKVAWSATAFQSFAQRSNHFPNLRRFVLEDSTSDVDAGPLLASIPSITSMHLFHYIYPCNTQAIFDHLTLNGLASGSLAPRLQSLWVGYVSNVEEFMDMARSRRENTRMSSNGVPAFMRVSFHGCDTRRVLQYVF